MIQRAGNSDDTARVDLASRADFELGGLLIRPARRQLCTSAGECREVEPRVMQVLVALAERPGEVVSRDQLIDLCWEGRIVGDDSLNRCIVALRRLAKDYDPSPFRIETVSRVGYTLVPGEAGAPAAEAPGWPRRGILLAAAGGVAAAASGAWMLLGRGDNPQRAQRLVVLPFRSDEASADLAEGLSLETIALLSLLPGLEVVPADSARRLAPAERSAAGAAERLRASLALTASIRSDADSVAAAVQLLAAPSGSVLWSETFRRPSAELALLQREVAVRTAQTVGIQASLPRVGGVSGIAFRHYLEGRRALAGYPGSPRDALAAFELAVAEASGFARAWSGLAAAAYRVAHWEMVLAPPEVARRRLAGVERIPQIDAAAQRALELGEASAEPWEAVADAASFVWRWPTAARAAEEARRRNGAPLQALRRMGRWRDVADFMSRAVALDRLSPDRHAYLGQAYLHLGDYDRAWRTANRSFELERTPHVAFGMVLHSVQEGRIEEGRRIFHAEAALIDEFLVRTPPLDRALLAYLLGEAPRPNPGPIVAEVEAGDAHADAAIFYLTQIGALDEAEAMVGHLGPGHVTLDFYFWRSMAPFRRRPAFWHEMERVRLLPYWRAGGRPPDFCQEEPCEPLTG
jgi:DNA-binding winged helix-turn-helix (wHTH) protein/TolB-like protein